MPASLLASQFATLEPPRDAIDVDIRSSVAAQVDAIVDALRRDAARTQCTSGEAVGDSAAAPTGDAAGGAGHR